MGCNHNAVYLQNLGQKLCKCDDIYRLREELERAKDRTDHWCERAEAAESSLKRLREEVWAERALEAQKKQQLRAVVKAVEWVEEDSEMAGRCPWCWHTENDDHSPDCARQRALREGK